MTTFFVDPITVRGNEYSFPFLKNFERNKYPIHILSNDSKTFHSFHLFSRNIKESVSILTIKTDFKMHPLLFLAFYTCNYLREV